LGRSNEAIKEFQRILEHRTITLVRAIHPLSQLQIARAWAMAANGPDAPEKANALVSARKAYQDFLALWKDAPENNPLVQQAKAEYAKLN
jgi:hypothetical protein